MFSDLAPKFQMYRSPNDQKRHYTCKQAYYQKMERTKIFQKS